MKSPSSKYPSFKPKWVALARFVLQIAALSFFVSSFGYQAFSIPSGSMRGTLLVGDRVVVSKFAYGYSRYSTFGVALPFEGRVFARPPRRGDVIVFRLPREPRTSYIKRVIGLPGDKVQLRDGVLYINGNRIARRRVGDFEYIDSDGVKRRIEQFEETLPNGVRYRILEADPSGDLDTTPTFRVPDDSYFVLGDNRDNSADSRLPRDLGVGFVPFDNIVGRADLIVVSLGGQSRISQPWRWLGGVRWKRFFHRIR